MAEGKLEVVISAVDNASSEIKKVAESTEKSTEKMKASFAAAGIAAAGLLATFGLLAKSAIDGAASYEQNRVAFETMLGSADKAKKLLKEVSDFAQKTPFELPDVVEASKRLLAYGISASDLIPTLRTLGDVSMGNKDKLNSIILAYGQVNAATKLTGAELRQFTEAGIPLLQALADSANKTGGHWVTMGGSAKKAKVDVAELNDHLSISKKRLEEASKSGKTHESTLMGLKDTVQDYEKKIASATTATSKQGKVWVDAKVTIEDIQQQVSDGAIKFADVQKALQGMTEKGGKFFGLMETQSGTFAGTISNISDSWGKFVRSVVGIDEEGTIKDKSIFAKLKQGASAVLDTMEKVRGPVTSFVNVLSQNEYALYGIAGAIGGLIVLALAALVIAIQPALLFLAAFTAGGIAIGLAATFIVKHWQQLQPTLQPVIDFLKKVFDDISQGLLKFINDNIPTFMAIWQTMVGVLQVGLDFISAIWNAVWPALRETFSGVWMMIKGIFEVIWGAMQVLLAVGLGLFTGKWSEAWNLMKEGFQNILGGLATYFSGWWTTIRGFFRVGIDSIIGMLNGFISTINKVGGNMGLKVSIPNIPSFDNGGWVNDTGLAMVHRGEFVMSNDMIAGKQSVPINTTNNNTPTFNITANIQSISDIDLLGQRLAFQLATSGRL